MPASALPSAPPGGCHACPCHLSSPLPHLVAVMCVLDSPRVGSNVDLALVPTSPHVPGRSDARGSDAGGAEAPEGGVGEGHAARGFAAGAAGRISAVRRVQKCARLCGGTQEVRGPGSQGIPTGRAAEGSEGTAEQARRTGLQRPLAAGGREASLGTGLVPHPVPLIQ